MDSRAAERLIRSLSFDVEAIPHQDNDLKIPTNQAPMNLKIRVRKKEGMVLQKNTVLTIPNMSHPERAPERVRLASSDTTIMSFDVLMETDSERRPAKKHRRLFGGCFGTTSGDEETPYEPGSTQKDNKSETNLTLLKVHGNEIENPILTRSKNTTFFGKCKPGGCLDPPFGEDRYKYQPKHTKNATVSSKDLQMTSSRDKITNKSLSKDEPSQETATPERGRIRNKSDSTEKDLKPHARQTSKSGLLRAEAVGGSRTIIVKEVRKSNNDLKTAHGSGRSSRDNSPEMYNQIKRDSRYQILEPMIKRSRGNSLETPQKQQSVILEHTKKRSSRENSPERNKVMHDMIDKSQYLQKIPDSKIHEEKADTSTTDARKVVKRDSKDHSQPRGLTKTNSHELDKQYEKSSRGHISLMEKRHIQKSSRESSLEQKPTTPVNTSELDKYYQRNSIDLVYEMDRQVKQSSRERSPESDTSIKKIKIDHTPVFEEKRTIQENVYMKRVESERSENTNVELTKRNSNMKTQSTPSNAPAKSLGNLDNTISHVDSYKTNQQNPKKNYPKEISEDVSKVVVDDTDSIITYPPAMTSSELQFEEKKIEKRNTSKRNSISNSISSSRARSSVNEFTNKYFSPPKKDKVRDSYASIIYPQQDNVFSGTIDKETTHTKKETTSEIAIKERNSLESMNVRRVEESHLNATSDILEKYPYAISKDSVIRDDMNIPMPQGRKSIDTLNKKQEIDKKPDKIRSDLDDETQNYPFISRSEMYEVDAIDDTQQNGTVSVSSEKMERIRSDDQVSENDTVYQNNQNMTGISKSNVPTNNVTVNETNRTTIGGSASNDENNLKNIIYAEEGSTTGTSKDNNLARDQLNHEQATTLNTVSQNNIDSKLYLTLNDAEESSARYGDNHYTENIFQDPKTDYNEISARYSSVSGNNEAISNYDKLTSKVPDTSADYYVEDTPRNYDLYNEEGKYINNVNGDRINDSYVQLETESNNYLRLQDQMNGNEAGNQRYFNEENYYAPATDVENKTPYFSEADYYELGTDEGNKLRHFKDDDHNVSATYAENQSPSDYQNSVDINSFRTLNEAVKADNNDARSKSYHSGDSRLPVKEDFTQLNVKKIRESTDGGIKSQDWHDFIKKEGINTTRVATPPRSYMIDSKKIGGNELHAENEQQKAKETIRETPPVERYDHNQSHSGKHVDSVFLELAIQTQHKSEDAILKSSYVSSGPNTRVIKTVLNAQNDKVRIPIDDQNELSIQFKKFCPGSTASSQRIQFLLPRTQSQSGQDSEVMGSMHTTNMKDDRKSDVKGNSLLSLDRFGNDLRETLSFVYENHLVPLQNTIKSLKEDIDFLASQQVLLRDRIHGTSSSRRFRPVRLIHSSKRCVCIGNPRY